jgi:hypothetical protein
VESPAFRRGSVNAESKTGTIEEDRLVPSAVGRAFTDAFQHSLWWVAGFLAVIFLAMFALPARPKQQVEGAAAGPADVQGVDVADAPEVSMKEPVFTS